MAKLNTAWTVLEHGPLEQLADNLWVVDAALPDMPLGRRMTIIRRDDRSLVIHNGVAVSDEVREQVEALGPIGLLIVPNAFHRLDAPAFKARYPEAKIACPRGCRKKVEEAVSVDLTYDEIEADGALRVEHWDGSREGEGALLITSPDGLTLLVNDAIFNLPKMGGLFGLIYGRLMGNAGGPKITTITRLFLLKEKKAFKAHLLRVAELGVERLIMSHGDVVRSGASDVLKQLANTL